MKIYRIISLILAICMMSSYAVSAEDSDMALLFERKYSEYSPIMDLSIDKNKKSMENFDNNIKIIWDSLNKNEDRTKLFEDANVSVDESNHYGFHITFVRLLTLAKGYKRVGSGYYGNQQLKEDILSALYFMNNAGYSTKNTRDGNVAMNWYYWEISMPQSIVGILYLMKNDMPTSLYEEYVAAVKHLMYSINTIWMGRYMATGANLAWKCNLYVSIGVINNEPDMIYTGVNSMDSLFDYSDQLGTLDGFYTDGSFIQHDYVPYNGGYGSSHVGEVLSVAYFVRGTKYEFSDEKKEIMSKWAIDGFLPLIYNGNMMDMVRGREIARSNSTDYTRGISNLVMCFKIGMLSDEENRKAIYDEVVKQVIKSEKIKQDFFGALSDDAQRQEAQKAISEYQGGQEDSPQMKLYNAMAKAVYKGSDFAFGISMFSDKTSTHEYHPTEFENKHAWYISHGATYLYNDDFTQYSRNYWPTVNPYRLAGTTVTDKEMQTNIQGVTNRSPFAGGTSLSAGFGVVGMDLNDFPDGTGKEMNAKKSWFCFDDKIVAMGSVSCEGEHSVYTTAENRSVSENTEVLIDGKKLSSESTLSGNIKRAYIGGINNTGYVFKNGAKADASFKKRSGAWSDISEKSYNSDETVSNDYVTFTVNHGVKPQDSRYEYVTLPNISKKDFSDYVPENDYEVLENSDSVCGIKSLENNMAMINFFEPKSLNGITVDKPCSVIVKDADGYLEISVADPTRKTDKIIVEIDKKAGDAVEASPYITVIQTEPALKLSVNTGKMYGGVFEAVFQSDTDFTTKHREKNREELKIQNTDIFKVGSSSFLKNSEAVPVYKADRKASIQLVNGETMMPLGCIVSYYNAVIGKDRGTVSIECGGKKQILESKKIKETDGITYIPLRFFFEEFLGLTVEYADGIIFVGSDAPDSAVIKAVSERLW